MDGHLSPHPHTPLSPPKSVASSAYSGRYTHRLSPRRPTEKTGEVSVSGTVLDHTVPIEHRPMTRAERVLRLGSPLQPTSPMGACAPEGHPTFGRDAGDDDIEKCRRNSDNRVTAGCFEPRVVCQRKLHPAFFGRAHLNHAVRRHARVCPFIRSRVWQGP